MIQDFFPEKRIVDREVFASEKVTSFNRLKEIIKGYFCTFTSPAKNYLKSENTPKKREEENYKLICVCVPT